MNGHDENTRLVIDEESEFTHDQYLSLLETHIDKWGVSAEANEKALKRIYPTSPENQAFLDMCDEWAKENDINGQTTS